MSLWRRADLKIVLPTLPVLSCRCPSRTSSLYRLRLHAYEADFSSSAPAEGGVASFIYSKQNEREGHCVGPFTSTDGPLHEHSGSVSELSEEEFEAFWGLSWRVQNICDDTPKRNRKLLAQTK